VIIGIGMDLVEIDRIVAMLARGERALERLFAPREAAYIRSRPFPAQHAAARLAAKEAAFKALAGNALARRIGWRDIEVVTGWDGAPTLEFHGAAAERADELGVTRRHLTLTHSRTTAAAMVVLERE
jgi:holo-[acyl-carrier protein] synthase